MKDIEHHMLHFFDNHDESDWRAQNLQELLKKENH
jgi:hypothetical protein